MHLEINVSGKLPKFVQELMEKFLDVLVNTLAACGVNPQNIVGGVSFTKEEENHG